MATVPVVPLAAAVADDQPPARPGGADGRSPSASASRSSWASLLAVGVGAGALYAWGQQYDDKVLPGVSIGSTALGGLTREQAGAAIANAYSSLGTGQITLTGPDGADDDHQLRRRGSRPRHLGAGRRGSRRRPPGRPAREPPRRSSGRPPRRDHRPCRRLRPRQAGGRHRYPGNEDRPEPHRRVRVDRRRRDVQRLPGGGRSRGGQGDAADRARPAARGARRRRRRSR